MGEYELWQDDSPLWARPQYGEMKLYPAGVLQVVAHTPVTEPLYEQDLVTFDNFSTYRNGNPIGNERFVWIDTLKAGNYTIRKGKSDDENCDHSCGYCSDNPDHDRYYYVLSVWSGRGNRTATDHGAYRIYHLQYRR